MKLMLTGAAKKRPFPVFFWIILLAVPAITLWIVANLLLWQTHFFQTILLLTRVTLHLIPPLVWLGGGAMVALWLAVLTRLWQRPLQ